MTLDLLPTDEMVTELKRRYPLLLIAGSVDLNQDCSVEMMFYQGPMLALLGLTDIIHEDLLSQYQDNLEDAEDIP